MAPSKAGVAARCGQTRSCGGAYSCAAPATTSAFGPSTMSLRVSKYLLRRTTSGDHLPDRASLGIGFRLRIRRGGRGGRRAVAGF
jgi:hypothetical protein